MVAMTATHNESTEKEAIMALDITKNTTFFEWLDEALSFAGDNQTSDIQTLELQIGEGRTKEMYVVRVHPKDA